MEAMLRVTVEEAPAEVRLHFEGRLAGPWVREVEQCWKAAQPSIAGKAVTVDLRSVDFVDAAGKRLLAAMHRQGARLIATGAMTNHLVSRISREPRRKGGPEAGMLP